MICNSFLLSKGSNLSGTARVTANIAEPINAINIINKNNLARSGVANNGPKAAR